MSPRSRKRGGGRSGRRRKDRAQAARTRPAEFWGDPAALPNERRDVRITDAPSALARSLGPPPLPGQEVIAEHYFAAVYERSVALAGALAAAGELIRPEDLLDENG